MKYNIPDIKCGIITMHRPKNFGSALQAFALQTCIERIGGHCEVIDYVYPNTQHQQNSLDSQFKSIINSFIKRLIGRGEFEKSSLAFSDFLNNYLKLSRIFNSSKELRHNPPLYDVYIAGSDQIWRASYIKADDSYFCAFAPKDKIVVSYAASFGAIDIPQSSVDWYKTHLKRFKALSVRETEAVDLVKSLFGLHAEHVLDPTLLLTAEEWKPFMPQIPISEPYVLCYGTVYSKEYIREFAQFVRKHTGLKVVFLCGRPWERYRRNETYIFDAGPLEFLSWIKNADLVLTQSFHGTIFAANFNRPFYSIHNTAKTKNTRQVSMLNQISCPDRAISIDQPFPDPQSFYKIDWMQVNSDLQALRAHSFEYLRSALQ